MTKKLRGKGRYILNVLKKSDIDLIIDGLGLLAEAEQKFRDDGIKDIEELKEQLRDADVVELILRWKKKNG